MSQWHVCFGLRGEFAYHQEHECSTATLLKTLARDP